jgi:predicted ATPase/serine phosphatase RsbU (regulator of sigma subunit)
MSSGSVPARIGGLPHAGRTGEAGAAGQPGRPPDQLRAVAACAAAALCQFADLVVIHVADAADGWPPGAPAAAIRLRRVAFASPAGRTGDATPRESAPLAAGGLAERESVHLHGGDPAARRLAAGQLIQVPWPPPATAAPEGSEILIRQLVAPAAGGSVIVKPLWPDQTFLGCVTLARGPQRPPWSTAELAAMERLAIPVVQALGAARGFARERKLADELRRMAVPVMPPSLRGVELCCRYLPDCRGDRVGGDWYDAIAVPGDRIALVVGDVMGHGARAVALMSQCRTIVHSLAPLDLPPEELLGHFDNLAGRFGDEFLATCLYAVYDPATRLCQITSAGHLPPVLVRPCGRSEILDVPPGAPLGVGGIAGTGRSRCFSIPDGSVLAMFTDGLLETGRRDIGASIQRLCVSLARRAADRLDTICDDVLREFDAHDRSDDVTLLTARLWASGRQPGTGPANTGTSPATASFPAAVRAPRSRRGTNLPGELTEFIGRREEAARIRAALTSARLVTLTGVAGVGKSRLAREVAAALCPAYPDGVWLVELSGVQDAGLVPHAVGEVVGARDQTVRLQARVLGDYLAGKRMLVVLDTCEHLVDACAQLAEMLLPAAPGLSILATSRQPLGLPGEHRHVVAPLPVEPPAASPGEPSAAVALFAHRAAAAVPGFALSADNVATVTRLCRQLDGIPLAIELAAVRLRALPLEEIVARLDDRSGLLGKGSPAAPPRHQTLRAAIGWSHELCEPAERLLWARVSVFANWFSLDAARFVCADRRLPAAAVGDTLAALVEKSIVVRDDGSQGVRYRLLGSIRSYGREWLRTLSEEDQARRRHRDWFRGS